MTDASHPQTSAVHRSQPIDPSSGAVVPPIYLSTTFQRAADGSYPGGHVYSRDTNPNRLLLEDSLAALEGGEAAAAFASGSVAMMTVLQALSPTDHIVAPDDIYFGVRLILTELMGPWGLKVSFVDMTNVAEVEAALLPETRLLIVETPSNPLLKVADLGALAKLAHGAGAYLLVDNTIATPILQQPLALGADLVVHATTKYLGGHSDVVGGAVITAQRTPLWERLERFQKIGGAVPSPFDCWLTTRGIQTIGLRMQAHVANAQAVSAFLSDHPAIERVMYPGLSTHPTYGIAQRQMSGPGALMSILVRGGEAEAMGVAARVKLFTRATSFGGAHSLIEHRASVEAPGTRTPLNLLRLSIGLEDSSDLMADLDQALSSIR